MAKILQNHYVLAVHNAKASADYFINVLGFRPLDVADEGWRFVKKDNCMVMIGECPGATPAGKLGDHSYFGYLVVDDVDAYFEELKLKRAELLSEVSDKPWGIREFGIRTPDGHRIMIGQKVGDGGMG